MNFSENNKNLYAITYINKSNVCKSQLDLLLNWMNIEFQVRYVCSYISIYHVFFIIWRYSRYNVKPNNTWTSQDNSTKTYFYYENVVIYLFHYSLLKTMQTLNIWVISYFMYAWFKKMRKEALWCGLNWKL